jgi:hypothetical protein
MSLFPPRRTLKNALQAYSPRRFRDEIFGVLRQKTMKAYLIAFLISSIGTAAQYTVLLLVVEKAGGARAVALLSAAESVPLIVLTPWGAALYASGNVSPMTLYRWSQIACAIQAAALCACALTGHLNLIWVLLLETGLGAINGAQVPSGNTVLQTLATVKGLRPLTVLSTRDVLSHVGSIASGAAVAMSAFIVAGPAPVLAFNSLTYLVRLAMIHPIKVAAESKPLISRRPSWIGDMKRDAQVRWDVILSAAVTWFGGLVGFYLPVLSGGSLLQLSWLRSASAAGALCGTLLLLRNPGYLKVRQIVSLSAQAIALSLALIALSPLVALPIVLLGIFMAIQNTSTTGAIGDSAKWTTPDHEDVAATMHLLVRTRTLFQLVATATVLALGPLVSAKIILAAAAGGLFSVVLMHKHSAKVEQYLRAIMPPSHRGL